MSYDRGDRGDGDRPNDNPTGAVSAFVYLGEKFRSFCEAAHIVARHEVPEEGADALLRAIEGEIIPRLMLAHQPEARPEVESPSVAPPPELADEIQAHDHVEFLSIVRSDSAVEMRRFIDGLLERGVPRDVVMLGLLGPAARTLGELWERDEADFTEVTIGLCRLHEVLRELAPPYGIGISPDAPRALLATARSDQHVFGVVMVAEFFRAEGWEVWCEPGAPLGQLESLVREQSFDLIGLSASNSADIEELAEEVKTLKKASRNAQLQVMVGGRIFQEHPEYAARIGADAQSPDGRTAPRLARELLSGPGR